MLGTLGDISISSPRKPLGTAHGALLVCDLPLDTTPRSSCLCNRSAPTSGNSIAAFTSL